MVCVNTQAQTFKRAENESIQQYINRFKATDLAYIIITRNGQDSSESQFFAMILILNANLLTKTFFDLISIIINIVSPKKRNDNDNTAINTSPLVEKVSLMKQGEKVDEEKVNEFITTTEAAISAQKSRTDKNDKEDISRFKTQYVP